MSPVWKLCQPEFGEKAEPTSNPGNSLAAASSFCDGGTETVGATKDAYVDQAQSNSNTGTAVSLFARSNVLGDRRTLVEFTLPPIPPHCSLTVANLRLFATAASGGRTIDVYALAGSWTETGVTWNNQPATAGSATAGASGTGWRTWDATAAVTAMYSGTNNGFLVRDRNEGTLIAQTQQYQSREGSPDSQDPELQLTFG